MSLTPATPTPDQPTPPASGTAVGIGSSELVLPPSPVVVPFVSGIARIRFDVAAHDLAGLRKATLALLDMIDESPCAPGWAYGGMEGNGVANPVTYRKAQHDETGRMLDWPSEDPLPRGYSFLQNASDEPRPLGAVGSGRLFDSPASDAK